jgi:hypothetical protein
MLGHWNAGLRGGKWTFFEGGIRPAAFVASPRLPPSARGQWWNGTIHLVDWSATFVALAGLPSIGDVIDGVDQWDAIASAGSGGGDGDSDVNTVDCDGIDNIGVDDNISHVHKGKCMGSSALKPLVPRNETLITAGVIVVGNWKLATVSLGGYGECSAHGRQGWDCLLGTAGGWMSRLAVGEVGQNTNLCPTIRCANVSDDGGVDDWMCSGQCNVSHPCLFDVVRWVMLDACG